MSSNAWPKEANARAPTPDVEAVAAISLEGNIIPVEWYAKITFDNKKPDLNAIIILSDILYWYKPSTIRDEYSGQIIGYKRKFKADLLQRSYDAFADQFGLSKRQATEAIIRLEKAGFIKRIFRTVKAGGQAHSNVLFIKVFPKKIQSITLMRKHFPGGSPIQKGEVSPLKGKALTPKRETYTTTSQQYKHSSSAPQGSVDGGENVKEMLGVWDQYVKESKTTSSMTHTRSQKLSLAFRDYFDSDINQWESYCKSIASSRFLMGETKESFKANIDWALKRDTIVRVQDGSFSLGDRVVKDPAQKTVSLDDTDFQQALKDGTCTPERAKDHFLQRIKGGLEGPERQRALETYGWEKAGFEKLFTTYLETLSL